MSDRIELKKLATYPLICSWKLGVVMRFFFSWLVPGLTFLKGITQFIKRDNYSKLSFWEVVSFVVTNLVLRLRI